MMKEMRTEKLFIDNKRIAHITDANTLLSQLRIIIIF